MWAALPVVLAACPKMVAQDGHTGKDGKAKTAKVMTFPEGEPKGSEKQVKDIVTYPGGDRVDWKKFQIPMKADVTITLKWKPPRPGLDLSMNLLDDTMNIVDKAKPQKKGVRKTKKTIKVKGADPGEYFVQVYASERGDAGAYTLTVKWKEHVPEASGGDSVLEDLPLPPKLAALPVPPPPVDPNVPPVVPPPVVDDKPVVKAVKANITELSLSGSDVLVILDKGKGAGIDAKWTGQILKGGTGDKFLTKSDVDLVVIRVSEDEATAKVPKLSIDQIGANRRVVLKPPPAE